MPKQLHKNRLSFYLVAKVTLPPTTLLVVEFAAEN